MLVLSQHTMWYILLINQSNRIYNKMLDACLEHSIKHGYLIRAVQFECFVIAIGSSYNWTPILHDLILQQLIFYFISIAWQTLTERTTSILEMNSVSSFPRPSVPGIME